jgi:prophage antirepressor-like protein
MSLTLNLGVKGFGSGESEKEVRIFSLRGCHLIAMFARTAIAKQFRKWVLDVLDKETLRNDTPYQMPLPTMSDKRTRIPLKDAVTLLVAKSRNMNYSEAYSLIHQRFDVDSVEDLTNEQIPLAVEYIHRVVGEFIGKEALPSPVAPLDFQHLDLLHGQVDYWQVRKALDVLSNIIYQYQPYSHVKPVFNIITAAENMLTRLWTIIDESGIKVEILKAAAKTGKPLTEANQDTIAHLQAMMSSKVMVVQLP